MNVEKLKRLQQQVRIGGKGTPRRKKKIMHQTAATDDKKLQSSLKKLSVSTIPGIEEVNIIKDDLTVIHFNNPKAQASLSANTFAVTGHGEVKKIVEMLPELLPQLGQETVVQLRMFANSISNNQKQTGEQPNATDGAADDDDDVPMLVVDFDQVAKIEATKQNESGVITDESQKSLNKNEKDTNEPIIASVENTPNNAKKAPPAAGSSNGEQKKQTQKPQTKPNETQKKQVKEKGVGNNQKNEKAKEAMKRNEKPKDKLAVAENKVGDQVPTKSVKQVSAANEQPADKSVDNVKVSLVGTEGVAVPKELTPEKVEVKENKQENVKSKVNKKGNIESKENKQDQQQQQTDKPVAVDKGKKQQQKVKQDKQNARQPMNKQTDKAGGNNANGQAKSVESKTKSTNQDDERKQLKAEEKKVEQKLIIEAVQLTKTDSSEANIVEPLLKSSIEIKEKQLNVEQKPQPTTVEIDNSAPKKDKSADANAGQSTLKPEQIEPTSDGKPVTQKTDVKATGETKAAKEVKVVGEQQAKANVQEPLAVEHNAIKTAKQENENVNKPKTTEQLLVAEKVSLQKTAPKQNPVKKSPPPQGGKVQPQPKSNIQQEQGNVQEPQPSGQASKAKTQTGPIQQTGVKQQSPSKSPPKQQQQQQAPNKKDTEAKKQEGISKQKSGAIKSQAQQLQQPVSNNGNKGQKPAVSPNKPITPATPTTTPTTTPATPASTTPKPATPASSTPKPTTPIATSPKGGTPTPVQAKKANTPPQKSEDVKGLKSAALKAQNQQTSRGNANAVQQTQQGTKAQKVQKNTEVAANTLAPLKTAAASPKTTESPQSPSLPEPLAVSPVKVDQGQVGAVLTSVKEPPTPVTTALPAPIANESAQIAVSPALASPSAPAPAPPSPVAATPIPTTAPASNGASTPTATSALPAVLPSPIGASPSPLSAAPTSAATPSPLPLLLPTPAAPTLAQVAPAAPPSPNVIAPALNTTIPDPNSSTTPAAQISTASPSVIAPLGTPLAVGEMTPLPVVDAPAPVENPPKTVLTATPDPIITPSVPDPNLITNAAPTTTAVPVSPTKAGTPAGPN